MAKGFKKGSYNPLNFKVIGNPQPETAKENTIWVDTDTINNYFFSATQPENMAEYDVWFPTVTSSTAEYNALKKNGIQVYPISAKQYVGGALVDVESKSYQNGEWVEWVTYLYNQGDECTSFTGGIVGWRCIGTLSGTGTITKNGNSITLTTPNSASIAASPDNAKDLTNYNKLYVNVISTNTDNRATIAVYSAKNAEGQIGSSSPITGTGVFSLDISGLDGKYFPVIRLFSQGGTLNVTFDKMWLGV